MGWFDGRWRCSVAGGLDLAQEVRPVLRWVGAVPHAAEAELEGFPERVGGVHDCLVALGEPVAFFGGGEPVALGAVARLVSGREVPDDVQVRSCAVQKCVVAGRRRSGRISGRAGTMSR